MRSGTGEFYNKNINSIWKVTYILLFIINAIFSFWLFLNGNKGHGIELTLFSFALLPIISLFHLSLLFGYDPIMTNKNNFGLLKVSFIMLMFVNLMVGYNLYNQTRDGIGLGFLGFIPFIFAIAINDIIMLLFLQQYTTYKGHT
jgi:uncharacterized membrane protein